MCHLRLVFDRDAHAVEAEMEIEAETERLLFDLLDNPDPAIRQRAAQIIVRPWVDAIREGAMSHADQP